MWYVGFIPQFTTAVWSGYPDAQVELSDFTVYNEPAGPRSTTTGRSAARCAPIWAQFMQYITVDLPVEDFPDPPDGFSEWFRIPKTTVPDVSGMSRDEAESAIAKAGLIASLVDTPSVQPEGTFWASRRPPAPRSPREAR